MTSKVLEPASDPAHRQRIFLAPGQVFGGASPGNFVNSIGQDNLAFACGFLEELGVPVGVGEQSGPAGCRIVFWPASGHVTHKPLTRVKETKVRRIILPLVKPLNLTPAAA